MPIELVPVTGSVLLPNGLGYAHALEFQLSEADRDGPDALAQAPVRVALADGALPPGFTLWRNMAGERGTLYEVTAYVTTLVAGGQVTLSKPYRLGRIQVGNAATYTLGELLAEDAGPAPVWIVNLDPAQYAALQAEIAASAAAAVTATAAADRAEVAATLVQYGLKKCAEPIFGFSDGVTDTQIFSGAQNVTQGFTVAQWAGSETFFYLQRVAGSTAFQLDEQFRIVWQVAPTVATPTAVGGFTAPIHLGHQQLSHYVDGAGDLKLVTQFATEAGHVGNDAGKGFSIINWRGAATDQTDVTNYQLFGYAGSGHRFEQYHGGTPAVSADGKWLVMIVQDVLSAEADALGLLQDNVNFMLIYDLAEVLAAPDPLDAIPRFVSQIEQPQRGERMQYTQAVACDGQHVLVARGYSNPRGRHLLMRYDFHGNLVGEYDTDGSRAPYMVEQLEGAGGDFGASFEPEGLAVRADGSILWLAMDEWRALAGSSVVSFEGLNFVCKSDTSDASPRDELRWCRTNAVPGGAWVDGAAYTAGNYTRKSKTVWSIEPITSAIGEYPMSAGKSLNASGAGQYLGSNQIDLAFDGNERFVIAGHSENTGRHYTALEFRDRQTLGLYDFEVGSDNTKRSVLQPNFRNTREYLAVRAYDSLSLGAGMNLYGNGDSVHAGKTIVFMPGGDSAFEIAADGRAAFRKGITPGQSVGMVDGSRASAVRTAVTGTTAETELYTVTMPGGCMGARGWLRISTQTGQTNNANGKTFRIKMGGVNVVASPNGYTGSGGTSRITRVANRGSQSSQVCHGANADNDPSESANGPTFTTVNTAADFVIQITGQLTNATDELALESVLIEVCYAP